MDHETEAAIELRDALTAVSSLLDQLVPIFHVYHEQCTEQLFAHYRSLHDIRWFGKSAVYIGQAFPDEIRKLARRITRVRELIFGIKYHFITNTDLDEAIQGIYAACDLRRPLGLTTLVLVGMPHTPD